MNAIAGGSGTGASQGRVVNGALVATSYTASTTTSKKTEAIHITLANGNVKEFGIEPEPPVDPDRLPITDAHRHGVYDPMTGSMLRVAGTGDPLTPEACRTGAGIFDGRMRYDLKLDFKRMETVKAEKGYRGPVVVCAVYFTPIAGYIPDRPVIKYLTAQRNIEIAFAPVAGTRILVPFWMKIPTPLGPAMLEATQLHHDGLAAAGREDELREVRFPFSPCGNGRISRMRGLPRDRPLVRLARDDPLQEETNPVDSSRF